MKNHRQPVSLFWPLVLIGLGLLLLLQNFGRLPFMQAAFQVMVGGALVFLAGILIGSA